MLISYYMCLWTIEAFLILDVETIVMSQILRANVPQDKYVCRVSGQILQCLWYSESMNMFYRSKFTHIYFAIEKSA